jgi:hypothetical protein
MSSPQADRVDPDAVHELLANAIGEELPQIDLVPGVLEQYAAFRRRRNRTAGLGMLAVTAVAVTATVIGARMATPATGTHVVAGGGRVPTASRTSPSASPSASAPPGYVAVPARNLPISGTVLVTNGGASLEVAYVVPSCSAPPDVPVTVDYSAYAVTLTLKTAPGYSPATSASSNGCTGTEFLTSTASLPTPIAGRPVTDSTSGETVTVIDAAAIPAVHNLPAGYQASDSALSLYPVTSTVTGVQRMYAAHGEGDALMLTAIPGSIASPTLPYMVKIGTSLVGSATATRYEYAPSGSGSEGSQIQ